MSGDNTLYKTFSRKAASQIGLLSWAAPFMWKLVKEDRGTCSLFNWTELEREKNAKEFCSSILGISDSAVGFTHCNFHLVETCEPTEKGRGPKIDLSQRDVLLTATMSLVVKTDPSRLQNLNKHYQRRKPPGTIKDDTHFLILITFLVSKANL